MGFMAKTDDIDARVITEYGSSTNIKEHIPVSESITPILFEKKAANCGSYAPRVSTP